MSELEWKALPASTSPLTPPALWAREDDLRQLSTLSAQRERLMLEISRLQHELATLESDRAERMEKLLVEARSTAASEIRPLLDSVEHALHRMRENLLRGASACCIEALRTLVGEHFRAEPNQILAPIEELLGRMPVEGAITIRVSAEQHAALEHRFADAISIRLRVDPSLSPGDVVLEVPDGQYDCRVEALLKEAESSIKQALVTALVGP